MRYFYTFFITALLVLPQVTHAAKLIVVERGDISTGMAILDVSLDTEGEDINALAGTVSIPSNYFSVDSVSTAGSIVSFWLTKPSVSKEWNFDATIHINFEGVFPGGFKGVQSPYYKGMRPGRLFTLTLRPEDTGTATMMLQNIDLRKNDGKATRIPVPDSGFSVTIPPLSTLPKASKQKPVSAELLQSSLQAFLTRDESVEHDKWILVIHDDAVDHTPRTYSVAESRHASPKDVSFYEWRKAMFPYVLAHQSRNYFIHIKAEYDDGTYSYTTLLPVENNADKTLPYRILSIITITIILGYVLRTKHHKKK